MKNVEVLRKQLTQAYDCLNEEQLAVIVVEQMSAVYLSEYMVKDGQAELVQYSIVAQVENTASAGFEQQTSQYLKKKYLDLQIQIVAKLWVQIAAHVGLASLAETTEVIVQILIRDQSTKVGEVYIKKEISCMDKEEPKL